MLREYTVFNVAQCDGLRDRILTPQAKAPRNKDQRDGLADEFLATTQADIREGGEAYYVPRRLGNRITSAIRQFLGSKTVRRLNYAP